MDKKAKFQDQNGVLTPSQIPSAKMENTQKNQEEAVKGGGKEVSSNKPQNSPTVSVRR